MPGGDRTGPMSGRGAGYCAGYTVPGYANPIGGRMGMGYGRGQGRGYGRGRGLRRGVCYSHPAYSPYAAATYPYYGPGYLCQGTMDSKQELDLLQSEAEDIKAELEAVNKRIDELKKRE